MTTIAVNSNIGNRRVPKEKKTQSNKVNVAINSVVGDSDHNNHSNDKIKTDSKLQPTAEQIRIANLMNDNRDDLDLKDKIEQIIELTGSTRDEAVVALHDCDNDTAKAIDMILEGDSLIESDWRTTGKKKKPPKTNSGDDSKPDMHTKDSKFETNKDSNRSHHKSEKTNNRITRPNVGPPRLQRAALANKIPRKPKEFRNERNEVDHNNDIFSTSAQQIFKGPSDLQSNNRRGDRRGGGVGRGTRGGSRGFGNRVSDRGSFSGGRGSRTFQNRGLSNDGFNTIDTWTNSTADQSSAKTAATDCNTMTVGNWSDIAANEDWSEEDWDSSHMETKVFTPSTKALAENDELLDVSANIGANSSASQPLNFSLLGKPSVESSQHSHPHQHQSMSSILSANISRSANVAAPGAALLQQLQQSSSSQSSTLNQYSLSQYNKQATESIKSLVGLSTNTSYNPNSDLLSSSERDLSNSLTNSQSANLTNKASRMKVARSSSKIPESAVEMPTSDSIGQLGVQFGALEFGTDNSSFSLGNDSSVFQDAVNHVTSKTKKSDQSSTLSSNSLLSASSDTTYRPSTNSSINDGKVGSSIIQNSVISHQSLTSDSLLDRKNKSGVNVGPYGQKVLDTTGKNASDSYSSVSPQQTVNDITSNYKNAYSSTDSGVYNSVTNYSTAPTVSYPYSSNSQSGVYGNQVVGNYPSNFAGSSITNHSSNSTQKLRDIDNNSQQKQYDMSSAIVTNAAGVGSLGLISNSTVTTNVLKNTLSATGKGLHSVPPGVATPVLSTPYIMSNATGLPIYPFPYDVQFQAPPTRDHNFATYAPQDVKYSRGSDSDVTSVSTSQTGAASQTHNQTFVNNVTFPPGYGFYFTPGVNLMTQSMYGTAAPIYPVTPAANTGSAGSAFSKSNTGYGSHSYNSSYDPITAVAQTQDYVKQGYGPSVQHPKGLSGSNADLSTANSAIYGKTHTQMTKSYDKQSFQTSTPPPFNLNASAQSAASAYGTPYILPHNQASLSLHHALQADANQTTATAVSAQRSMSQTHKGSAGTGSGYTKYNWS